MKNKDKKKSKKNISLIVGLVGILLVAVILVFALGKIKTTGNIIAKVEIVDNCGYKTIIYNDAHVCWQESVKNGTVGSWDEANNYCGNLVLGNQNDWRLPTLPELKKIRDMNKAELTINKDFFENTMKRHYWTSTIFNTAHSSHWYVHFGVGYQGYTSDIKSGYGVKCVRNNTIY